MDYGMMVDKLWELVAYNDITNAWEVDFLESMVRIRKVNGTFSRKQAEKIEELFERY